MKRTKSSISLRNLANSLKQSIYLDQHKLQKRQFIPLRNSASTVNLTNYTKTFDHHKNYNNKNQQDYLILLDTRRKSKINSVNDQNKNSNYSSTGYYTLNNINKNTHQQDIFKRKQKLLELTRKSTNFIRQSETCEIQPNQPTFNFLMSQNNQYYFTKSHTLQLLLKQHIELKKYLTVKFSEQNFSLKKYHKQLKQIDYLTQELKEISEKQRQYKEKYNELRQRVVFISEEVNSTQTNFIENIAQKQYCQQFLQKYQTSSQHYYKQQSKLVIEMLQKQLQTQKMSQIIIQTQKQVHDIEAQYKKWKQQEKIQLNEKRFQNKLKQNRIELMKIEQGLDQITDKLLEKMSKKQQVQNKIIRKVREYVCAYFKRYNQININHISHGQIADGIDIFLCKEGLVDEFTKYLKQNTQHIRLNNSLYAQKLDQYCNCLVKIQSLFYSQKNEINQVLSKKYQQKIIQLQQKLQSSIIKKDKNQRTIENLLQKIDTLLAQDSLSIIECLNKNTRNDYRISKTDGFFNINQIKHKIKQLKIDQVKRIKYVREIFFRSKKIQEKYIDYEQKNSELRQNLDKEKVKLQEEMKEWKNKLTEILHIKKGFQMKKQKYQITINDAIQMMKQKDQKQSQLKAIQKQIQQLKKQKINLMTKKFHQKTNKPSIQTYQASRKLKNHSFRFDVLQRTKSMWSKNISSKIDIKNQTVKNQKCNEVQNQQVSIAHFGVTKKYDIKKLEFEDRELSKMRRTQSSPQNYKQVEQPYSTNNILISRCNLIQSKTLPYKSTTLKRFSSQLKQSNYNKQNDFIDDDLLLTSNPNSIRSSIKKKSLSQKNSLSKLPKSTNKKITSNKNSNMKLSLNSKNSMKNGQKFQKDSQKNTRKTSINSILESKLLKR